MTRQRSSSSLFPLVHSTLLPSQNIQHDVPGCNGGLKYYIYFPAECKDWEKKQEFKLSCPPIRLKQTVEQVQPFSRKTS